jgi:hypothetical protein
MNQIDKTDQIDQITVFFCWRTFSASCQTRSMADNNALYAIRFPDGSLSLYIDEDYAIERGVDPATLTRVEIPRDMFVSGTIQEIREYVALYLESRHSGTA